ncbi:MAG: MFS transporter [Pseudomonadota bacterium]
MSTDQVAPLQLAKRSALIFAAAQAIVGSSAPVAISMGGLAGYYLLEADKTLATAPVTGFNIGLAVGALPAALLMRAVGRRHGFMAGSLVTALSGAIAGLALMMGDFWLFAIGLAVMGVGGAFVQQYRFAAADVSPPSFKATAISWVLGGGVFAAIIGPQLVIMTRNLMAPVEFAGAFFSVIGLGFVGFVILAFVHTRGQADLATADDEIIEGDERPLLEIIRQPRFLITFACGVTTYALMSFLMTGAPLAMVGCGYTPDEATIGISWHVMAMFAPSFFTGKLIARFGKETVVGAGLTILLLCALVALSGVQLWQFWLSLILLGIGWNFGFIGATAMLTDTYRPSEKNKVQGVHDFALFSTVALASLLSGAALNIFGETAEQAWFALNLIALPVAATCLAILVLHTLANRRQAQVPTT